MWGGRRGQNTRAEDEANEEGRRQDKAKATVTYYGKKTYLINPHIVRKQLVKNITSEYRYEDIDIEDLGRRKHDSATQIFR